MVSAVFHTSLDTRIGEAANEPQVPRAAGTSVASTAPPLAVVPPGATLVSDPIPPWAEEAANKLVSA